MSLPLAALVDRQTLGRLSVVDGQRRTKVDEIRPRRQLSGLSALHTPPGVHRVSPPVGRARSPAGPGWGNGNEQRSVVPVRHRGGAGSRRRGVGSDGPIGRVPGLQLTVDPGQPSRSGAVRGPDRCRDGHERPDRRQLRAGRAVPLGRGGGVVGLVAGLGVRQAVRARPGRRPAGRGEPRRRSWDGRSAASPNASTRWPRRSPPPAGEPRACGSCSPVAVSGSCEWPPSRPTSSR